MPTLRQILAALLTALAFLAILAARSAQAEPTGWRYMSGDLQAATSACIGSDESPVCAAETIIACSVSIGIEPFERHHPPIPRPFSPVCQAASSIGLPSLPLFRTQGPSPSADGIFLYLLDVWRLPDDPGPRMPHARAGDLVVDIYTGTCAEDTDDPRACSGLPFQGQERVDQCGQPDPNGFLLPEGSLAFREGPNGWRVGYFRSIWTEGNDRYPCERWRPERWRRDASDLIR